VQVLPRQRRLDRDERVPVIGRRDDDRVDVRAREHLVVVLVGLHVHAALALVGVELLDLRARRLEPLRVEIAHRDDPAEVVLDRALQILHPHAPAPDLGDGDLPARRRLARLGAEEVRARDDRGCEQPGGPGQRGLEEAAAGRPVLRTIRSILHDVSCELPTWVP
jgi:hypothetical protein